jgi:hypothetical protein
MKYYIELLSNGNKQSFIIEAEKAVNKIEIKDYFKQRLENPVTVLSLKEVTDTKLKSGVYYEN